VASTVEDTVMSHAQKHTDPSVTKLNKGEMTPTRHTLSPFEDFERLFSQLRHRDWLAPFHWSETAQSHLPMFAEGKMPKVDIIDREKELLIRAELPGVEKKDLDISMTESSVTIKADSYYEDKEEKGDYYRTEIAQGAYSRTIGLPADVDIDQAKTKFKHGVLELTVPKLERSQRRSINVE